MKKTIKEAESAAKVQEMEQEDLKEKLETFMETA